VWLNDADIAILANRSIGGPQPQQLRFRQVDSPHLKYSLKLHVIGCGMVLLCNTSRFASD